METRQLADIILFFCIFLGVLGTLLPALPGCAIILFGAVVHALMTSFEPIGMLYLAGYGVLFLISWIGQYVVTGLGSKKYGASKYGVFGAGLGMFVGLFLPFFGGLLVGAFLGAFIFEIVFAMKEPGEGARAGFGALVGTVASMFFGMFIGLVMGGLLAWQVLGA